MTLPLLLAKSAISLLKYIAKAMPTKKRFFVKFWGAKVSMHSWRGHALNTVRVLFRCVC